ncbi:polysaccharide pyruvyl transferase family protein [Rhodoferax sp. 4810]|nr:polysaccharide pyruvyl transferase family protein [Rhodoferax jenense]
MNNSPASLIAYGCVATVPKPAQLSQRLRRIIFSIRDRIAFRFGRLDMLDYRNHDDSATYNLGDHAIMIACLEAIDTVLPGTLITPVNWLELNTLNTFGDAILICGSGYFFLDPELRLPSRISDDAAFSEEHNLPIIIYGSGVNLPDASLRNETLQIDSTHLTILRRLLKRCIHISVRDEASRQLLQTCTDLRVEMIGDPAFLLKPRHTARNLNLASKRVLIGLNLPFHGPTQNRRLINELHVYIETFKIIQKHSGCLFHYMVHYDAEVVIAKIMIDAGIDMIIVRGTVDKLLVEYSQLNLHLGGMLHSCILSASTGTPCIGLAYDIKHAGFFDVLELPELCIPTEPWKRELIIETTLKALLDESRLRAHISQRRNFLQQKAFTFLKNSILSLTHES